VAAGIRIEDMTADMIRRHAKLNPELKELFPQHFGGAITDPIWVEAHRLRVLADLKLITLRHELMERYGADHWLVKKISL
jgi:hypothetical protein